MSRQGTSSFFSISFHYAWLSSEHIVSDTIDAFNLDESEKSPRVGCVSQAHERPTSRTWSFGCGLCVIRLDGCMSLKHTCIQFHSGIWSVDVFFLLGTYLGRCGQALSLPRRHNINRWLTTFDIQHRRSVFMATISLANGSFPDFIEVAAFCEDFA